jgi:hypothetical protein
MLLLQKAKRTRAANPSFAKMSYFKSKPNLIKACSGGRAATEKGRQLKLTCSCS